MSRKHNATGRSRQKLGRFVAIEHFVLTSAAWKSLSPVARAALIEMKYLYNGSNNGRLALSARVLSLNLAVSRATAHRALQDLEDRGFIESVQAGGFNVKSGSRRATEWRLTCCSCDVTNERASRKFMRWLPNKTI